MSRYERLLQQVLSGRADANISFEDLCHLLLRFGFETRIKGSHHLFLMAGVEELINLQRDGSKAKPYQVKQVRHIVMKYRFGE